MKAAAAAKKARVVAQVEEHHAEEEDEEMDPEIRKHLEAEKRQEESERMRQAANAVQAGFDRVLATFQSTRKAAQTETLNFLTMAVGCRERSSLARDTKATFVVPRRVAELAERPTYSNQHGKSCYTTRDGEALLLPTFVSEQNLKRGAGSTHVRLNPGSAMTIGTPDLPGNFPLGVPMVLYDVRASSYVMQPKEAAPSAAAAGSAASAGTVVVTYGAGSVIEHAEKPTQFNNVSSPSGLQNITLAGGEALRNLRFGESIMGWSRFAFTQARFTPTKFDEGDVKDNIVIIPTGPNIRDVVERLCGIKILAVTEHAFQGDAGKGIHGNSCGLSKEIDPDRKLQQSAYMRLMEFPNAERHRQSLEGGTPEPFGMSVAVRGYSELVTAYGIDPFALNKTRWSEGIVPYIHLADGFIIGWRNDKETAASALKLRDGSTVQAFDMSVFEEGGAAGGAGLDADDPVELSKLMQPSTATLSHPVQDWRGLVLSCGIRLRPSDAVALCKTFGTDNPTELIVSARPPVPNKKLISTFVPNGLCPLWLHMGPSDPVRRWMPVETSREYTTKGVKKILKVWTAPKHQAFRVEYYALSPTMARVGNRAEYAKRINSAGGEDSGMRFLDALVANNTLTGEEPVYKMEKKVKKGDKEVVELVPTEVGLCIQDLRRNRVVPMDTGANMLLFAVFIDAEDSPNPQWPDIMAVRPEVVAILDAINGPLPLSKEMVDHLKGLPDAALMTTHSHGSDIASRIGLGKRPREEVVSPKKAAAKPKQLPAKKTNPEPEPEPEEDMDEEAVAPVEEEDGDSGEAEAEEEEEAGEDEEEDEAVDEEEDEEAALDDE